MDMFGQRASAASCASLTLPLGISGYNNIFNFLKEFVEQRMSGTGTALNNDCATRSGDSGSPMMVVSPIFRQPAFGRHHPLSIARVETVYDLCRCLGWFDDSIVAVCEPAPMEEILRFHSAPYVAALERAETHQMVGTDDRNAFAIGTMENPWFPGLLKRARTAVGGSILAAQIASTGRTAFHPSGGTHHGRPDRAAGFCYFNDPVFAVMALLDAGFSRVGYVDVDAHHGDGVERAFLNDDRVLTASIHEVGRWPYTGLADIPNRNAFNILAPKHCSDHEFNALFENKLCHHLTEFQPEALVVTCGTDALAGDPLSTMQLSNVCLWDCVVQLQRFCKPFVVLGGGGYNPWTLARCWTGLWGRFLGGRLPERLPDAAVRILSELQCDLIDDDEVDPEWLVSLADRPRLDVGRADDAYTGLSQ